MVWRQILDKGVIDKFLVRNHNIFNYDVEKVVNIIVKLRFDYFSELKTHIV